MRNNGAVAEGSVLEAEWDPLGETARAEIVLNALTQLRAQEAELRTLLVVNDHDEDATIPGGTQTYAERLDDLRAACERLVDANAARMPTVERLARARQRQEVERVAEALGTSEKDG